MSLKYLGSLALSAAIPPILPTKAQVDLAISALLIEIQVKLAGLLKLGIDLGLTPPSIGAYLAAVAQIAAALSASLTLSPPTLNFSVLASLELIAKLQILLGLLTVAADFVAELGGLLAQGGIRAFVYEGPVGGLGSALAQAKGQAGITDTASVYGALFFADASLHATTTALKQVFAT